MIAAAVLCSGKALAATEGLTIETGLHRLLRTNEPEERGPLPQKQVEEIAKWAKDYLYSGIADMDALNEHFAVRSDYQVFLNKINEYREKNKGKEAESSKKSEGTSG